MTSRCRLCFDTSRDPAAPSIIGADQGELLSVKRLRLVGLGDMKMGAREQCNMGRPAGVLSSVRGHYWVKNLFAESSHRL